MRWCIAFAIACSGRPPAEPVTPIVPVVVVADAAIDAPPPPLDQDPPRLAARAVEEMQAVAAALTASGEDCAAAAAKLDAIRGKFADLLEANAKLLSAGKRAELKAAIALRQPDLDAAAHDVFGTKAIAACVKDPEFNRAFDEALGAPPPPP